MRLRLVMLLSAAAGIAACTQNSQPVPKTDEEKALYSLGALVSQGIKSFDLTDEELEMVKAGLADGARGKMVLEEEEIDGFIPKLQELNAERMTKAVERDKEAGATYLAKAASEEGAIKTDSGLVYKVVTEGTGASPKSSDTVKVHYEGRFVDGKVFDSSIERGEPIEFPLEGVVPCWTEGVQLMKVGGKGQLICPSDLAYGDMGRPEQGMPGGSTLVFDVELLEIIDPAAQPVAP